MLEKMIKRSIDLSDNVLVLFVLTWPCSKRLYFLWKRIFVILQSHTYLYDRSHVGSSDFAVGAIALTLVLIIRGKAGGCHFSGRKIAVSADSGSSKSAKNKRTSACTTRVTESTPEEKTESDESSSEKWLAQRLPRQLQSSAIQAQANTPTRIYVCYYQILSDGRTIAWWIYL